MRPPAGTLRWAFGPTAAHAFPEPGKTDVFLYGPAWYASSTATDS